MNPVQQPASRPVASEGSAKGRASLSITDNRTGKIYEVPIKDGAIHATDLRQIKTGTDDFGLMTYDPALNNTLPACISRASLSLMATSVSCSNVAIPLKRWPKKALTSKLPI